jgi:hypothetical protein
LLGPGANQSKRKKANGPQNDNQTIHEFDLRTDHGDWESLYDHEENMFEVQNDADLSNSHVVLDWDCWKYCRIRGGDFDGEESF